MEAVWQMNGEGEFKGRRVRETGEGSGEWE